MRTRHLSLGLVCCALVTAAVAQPTAPPTGPPQWQRQATAAEQAGEFARAIGLYRAQLVRTPDAVPVQIALGRALRLAGRADDARVIFNRILAANPNNVRALLSMAVIDAQAKDLKAANEWIGKAVAAGAIPLQIEAPAELTALRGTAAYKAHLERATRLANPCRFEAEYSAFDFWIGDWDIYVNGQLAWRNLITKEMNGCIIHERAYLLSGGYRGESINYYDPHERRWKQNFVSDGANVIAYAGNSPRAGVMEMSGTSVTPGVPGVQLQRVVWELRSDGSVSHTVSVSNDNGKSWSPGFAGRYVRSTRKTQTMLPDEIFPINTALLPAPSRE